MLLLNQPDPDAPLDGDRLVAEFQAGLGCFCDVPLSQTHLACLCLAAQRASCGPECSASIRTVLQQFQLWCAQHAAFGPETRKLLAQQAEHLHAAWLRRSGPGVQTPGPQPAEGA